MKAIILQEHFLKLLSKTGRIVSPKVQLPILGHVLLSTEDGRIKASTTTTELSVVSYASAKVEKEGGICVPVKILTEFVSTLPQEKVTIEEKNGALIVVCHGYKAAIPGMSKDEFPPLSLKKKAVTALPKKDIVEGLKRVLFAAATDEGRPVLTGVKMKKDGEDVLFVATDGYRLSVQRMSLKETVVPDAIVPARALSEAIRICDEDGGDSTIAMGSFDDGQTGIFIEDTEIHTRLIDGEYPNFEKIIPKSYTTTATINTQAFASAVKSAAIFAKESANIIRLHIEKGEISVSANTPQVGENTVTIEATIDGEGGDIAFNSRFLLEFLGNMTEETLVFEMTGSLNPGVFKLEKNDSYLHIIMPVRVQN